MYGIVDNTPVEKHGEFWVKREDLSAPEPGPAFSKYRGVVEHIRDRNEEMIGVLDTYRSKAGWAVAYACSLLGRKCLNFYPRYKTDVNEELRESQIRSRALGAELHPLTAGRSAVLFYAARKIMTRWESAYLMPNALKLPESVTANAAEAIRTDTSSFRTVAVPSSSGTIAAGVIRGITFKGERPRFIIHMGYSRPKHVLEEYITRFNNVDVDLHFIDEGYNYKDAARAGPNASFPCNPYYDLKAWRWMLKGHRVLRRPVLLWNIGA